MFNYSENLRACDEWKRKRSKVSRPWDCIASVLRTYTKPNPEKSLWHMPKFSKVPARVLPYWQDDDRKPIKKYLKAV